MRRECLEGEAEKRRDLRNLEAGLVEQLPQLLPAERLPLPPHLRPAQPARVELHSGRLHVGQHEVGAPHGGGDLGE